MPQVRRLLRLLKALQLGALVGALHEQLAAARKQGSLPSTASLSSFSSGSFAPPLALGSVPRRLPSQQAALLVLRRLRGAVLLVEELLPALRRAASQLLAQLAHSFFMPLCLTSLAVLARVQVLAGQLLLDSARAYNAVAELVPLLPPGASGGPLACTSCSAGPGGAAEEVGRLPQVLRCVWEAGLPRVEGAPFPPGASLREQAAAAAAAYGLGLPQQRQQAADRGAPRELPQRRRPGQEQQQRQRASGRGRSPAAGGVALLAVVEDRGVPISREALALAAVAAVAAPVFAEPAVPEVPVLQLPTAAPDAADPRLPAAVAEAPTRAPAGAAPSSCTQPEPVQQERGELLLAEEEDASAWKASLEPAEGVAVAGAAPGTAPAAAPLTEPGAGAPMQQQPQQQRLGLFWDVPPARPTAADAASQPRPTLPAAAAGAGSPAATLGARGAGAAAEVAAAVRDQAPTYYQASRGLGELQRGLDRQKLESVHAGPAPAPRPGTEARLPPPLAAAAKAPAEAAAPEPTAKLPGSAREPGGQPQLALVSIDAQAQKDTAPAPATASAAAPAQVFWFSEAAAGGSTAVAVAPDANASSTAGAPGGQKAAPLLDTRRKRKRPSAAAGAADAQQPAQPAKGWEDWLSPIGGGGGLGGASSSNNNGAGEAASLHRREGLLPATWAQGRARSEMERTVRTRRGDGGALARKSALVAAVAKDNAAVLERLLAEEGGALAAAAWRGPADFTLLHLAAVTDSAGAVAALARATGVPLDSEMLYHGSNEVQTFLEAQGITVPLRDTSGSCGHRTPLFLAALLAHEHAAVALAEAGASFQVDRHQFNSNIFSALMRTGNSSCAGMVLRRLLPFDLAGFEQAALEAGGVPALGLGKAAYPLSAWAAVAANGSLAVEAAAVAGGGEAPAVVTPQNLKMGKWEGQAPNDDTARCMLVGLSTEQAAAARAPEQAACLLAGAGSGKTRTIIARVLWLGSDPASILALTFSRKARRELEERLRSAGCLGVSVSTFHALAFRLLRERGAGQLSVIADEEKLRAMMRDVLAWDRLRLVQPMVCSWLFLDPGASWHDVAATAADRQPQLYAQSLAAATELLEEAEHLSDLPLAAQLLATPFPRLHPSLQLWTVCHLVMGLCRRFDPAFLKQLGNDARELWGASDSTAGAALAWSDRFKQAAGRLPPPPASPGADTAGGAGERGGEPDAAARLFARAAGELRAALAAARCIALSDLLPLVLESLRSDEVARAEVQTRWCHLLVDEAQDCTAAQMELLELMAGPDARVMLVGDPDQSIYGFLAAGGPAVFADFRRRRAATEYRLLDNWRSTPPICAFASALLRGNRRDVCKRLVAARRGAAAPVLVRRYETPGEEGAGVAALIARLRREQGVSLGDIAVLYRCLSHCEAEGGQPHAPVMAALRAAGVPFVLAGRGALAEEQLVRAIAPHVAAVANASDDSSFHELLLQQEEMAAAGALRLLRHQQLAARLAGRQASLLACAQEVCARWLSRRQQQRRAGREAEAEASPTTRAKQGSPTSREAQLAAAAAPPTADGGEEEDEEDGEEHGALALLLCLLQRLERLRREVADLDVPAALRVVLRAAGYLPCSAAANPDSQPPGEEQSPRSPLLEGPDAEEARLPPSLVALLERARQHVAEQAAEGQPAERGAEALQAFVASLALDGPAADEPEPAAGACGAVTIGTIHGAKGLEWPVVILPLVCEGFLPTAFKPDRLAADALSERGFFEARQALLEEERRLFHVAASRARDRLIVSYVQPTRAAGADGRAAASAGARQGGRFAHRPEATEEERALTCSGVLAAAIHALRREQPEVICTEGVGEELPDSRFFWYDCREQPPSAAQRAAQQVVPVGGVLQPAGNCPLSQPECIRLAMQQRQQQQQQKGCQRSVFDQQRANIVVVDI
eukprot:scaffold1.g5672.t1